MDKAKPDDRPASRTVLIRLSKCNLPGSGNTFRATIPFRRLITVEDLAQRLAERGCPGVIVLFSPAWSSMVLMMFAGAALVVMAGFLIYRAFTFGKEQLAAQKH